MSRVTKVTYINNADQEKIMEYIANVENHPAFISALKSISNLSGEATVVGTTWDWTYMMAGVELHGQSEATGHEAGKSYSYKTTGGADSSWTYSVEPSDEGVKLTIDIEYQVPEGVLGAVADAGVIEGINEKEGEQAAENLKAILEG